MSTYHIPWPVHYPRVLHLGAGMMALCLDQTAAGMDVAVDRPGDWWHPSASHHGMHAEGGAVVGVVGYMGAAMVTDASDERIAMGTALGLAVGVGYELARAGGSCVADPVDAAYVVAGAFVGAVLADLTNDAVTVALNPRGASVILAFRF